MDDPVELPVGPRLQVELRSADEQIVLEFDVEQGGPVEINSVLLVDDDPAICAIGEVALTAIGGWEVVTASSGEEAVSLAHKHAPDVIILDVMMPGCDGLQTLRNLRADVCTEGIPVLFMTAKVLPGEVGSYLDAGAEGVIAKPFDPVGLPDEIRRLLATTTVTSPSERVGG